EIIRDETQIEMGIKNLEGAQSIDLERNRGEMLTQIGKLENQNETHEFKEALELYVKPRGTWNVPTIKIIKASDGKKEEKMDYEARKGDEVRGDEVRDGDEIREGDVEEVVNRFLTSKERLTSHDKEILEDAANEFLIKPENKSLIKTVNGFFEPENQLTLEEINVLNGAVYQFFTLKDKNTVKILEMGLNEFLGTPKEKVLKNIICNLPESLFVFESKLSLKNKLYLVLVHITTDVDVEGLKE
ncbi:24591_t:CDS:1, partial [Cetraspora pellucida]